MNIAVPILTPANIRQVRSLLAEFEVECIQMPSLPFCSDCQSSIRHFTNKYAQDLHRYKSICYDISQFSLNLVQQIAASWEQKAFDLTVISGMKENMQKLVQENDNLSDKNQKLQQMIQALSSKIEEQEDTKKQCNLRTSPSKNSLTISEVDSPTRQYSQKIEDIGDLPINQFISQKSSPSPSHPSLQKRLEFMEEMIEELEIQIKNKQSENAAISEKLEMAEAQLELQQISFNQLSERFAALSFRFQQKQKTELQQQINHLNEEAHCKRNTLRMDLCQSLDEEANEDQIQFYEVYDLQRENPYKYGHIEDQIIEMPDEEESMSYDKTRENKLSNKTLELFSERTILKNRNHHKYSLNTSLRSNKSAPLIKPTMSVGINTPKLPICFKCNKHKITMERREFFIELQKAKIERQKKKKQHKQREQHSKRSTLGKVWNYFQKKIVKDRIKS